MREIAASVRMGKEPGQLRTGGLIAAGFMVTALFFGGLGSWAAMAPLASAAIAPGVVTVDSNRKTVQHLEGGIIAELPVRNGDFVSRGQVLLRLEDVESRAAFDLLNGQRRALLARQARLLAERDGRAEIEVPAELTSAKGDPQVTEIIAGQHQIFASREQLLTGQTAVMAQRIDQYRAEIASLNAQLAAGEAQLRLIEEELRGVGALFKKGLEKKSRLLALQREAARLKGLQGDYRGQIARAEQGIAQSRLEMLTIREKRGAEVVIELGEVQDELAHLAERLRSARARLERTTVLAPQDGLVLNLRYFTTGGVVEPGAPILDIVPQNDSLVVDARLDPDNIDEVRAGMPAEVRLTAFKQRVTPTVRGVVKQVSADALVDERSGRSYYAARVELARSDLQQSGAIALYPGMPCEVMIATGNRTALDYLLTPVAESFARAFREQ